MSGSFLPCLLLKAGSKACLFYRELLDLQLQPFTTGSRSAEPAEWPGVLGWLHHIVPASTDWTHSDCSILSLLTPSFPISIAGC